MLNYIRNNYHKLSFPEYRFYTPFLYLKTDQLSLTTKLFLYAYSKENPNLIYEMDGNQVRRNSDIKNTIVFSSHSYMYQFRYFKSYDTTTRPSTIKKAHGLGKINYAKFHDAIYLDVASNVLYVDTNYLEYVNQDFENKLLYAIFILKQLAINENMTKIATAVREATTKTDSEYIALYNKAINIVLDLIKYSAINSTTERIQRKFSVIIDEKNNAVKTEKSNCIRQLEGFERELQSLLYKKEHISEIIKNLTDYFVRLQKSNDIMFFDFDGDQLILTTNYLKMNFIDLEQLSRVVKENQLRLPEQRLDAIEKVVNLEASFITLPMLITVRFSAYSNTNYKPHFTFPNTEISARNYINQHAIISNGDGCLGSFKAPLEVAKIEDNLQKTIALLLQYVRSITVHDAMGDQMIVSSIIADNEDKIISCPLNPHFEGIYVKDIVEYRLVNKPTDYIQQFKEEHYGNQSNEER